MRYVGSIRLLAPFSMYQSARRDTELVVDALQLQLLHQDHPSKRIVVDGVKTAEPQLPAHGAVHLHHKWRRRAQSQRLVVQLAVGAFEDSVQSIGGAFELAQRCRDRGLHVDQLGCDARIIVDTQHGSRVCLNAMLPVSDGICEDSEMVEHVPKVLARC